MMQIVWVAAGGAVGAVMRYALVSLSQVWLGRDFPYGTLAVNVLGSLLISGAYVWLVERMALGGLSEPLRLALFVGVLGSFTTFSSFSMETIQLLEKGAVAPALLNVTFNVVLCLTACAVGLALARQL